MEAETDIAPLIIPSIFYDDNSVCPFGINDLLLRISSYQSPFHATEVGWNAKETKHIPNGGYCCTCVHLMVWSHVSTTVSRPLRANHSFPKMSLRALDKCLASAWDVIDDWFMISCSHAISHDWSTTTWQVDNDCRPSWARLNCSAPFTIVIAKSCCHVNGALSVK